MPLGGANIGWNEASPAETDVADAGPIRSIETAIRNAMGSEHNWPATGGANTGYHLLGSARPFYDVQSNVSSSGTDGRLLLTSDTSRLFGVGSGGTVLLGGATSLLVNPYPGVVPQRAYWAMETGTVATAANGVATVTPSAAFNGVPVVTLTVVDTSKVGLAASIGATLNATQFEVFAYRSSTGAGGAYTVHWTSVGTRNL